MRMFRNIALFSALFLLSTAGLARSIDISSVHYWTAPEKARLMIDVSSIPKHRVRLQEQPSRLIIDIQDAHLERSLGQPPSSHPIFSKLQTTQNRNGVRIVVNLKRKVSQRNYTLKPNKMYGNRLVVDLSDSEALVQSKAGASTQHKADTPSKQAKSVAKSKNVAKKQSIESSQMLTVAGKSRNIIIAIDAGHGGEDPGAHGIEGTEEKKVVFAIARKLESLINAQKGMKAVMVRTGDYYVDLRKRMDIARSADADLFISIHADAFTKTDVKGASVFTLSHRGASSEAARWLADSENAAGLVGGVRLDDKEEDVASILLDLSQMHTQEASNKVAKHVLKNFQSIGELHFGTVQKAGFMVLKSPDIPSILIETGFISNPSEERKLQSSRHQSKIASAIFKGVRDYFKQFAPVDTRVAEL